MSGSAHDSERDFQRTPQLKLTSKSGMNSLFQQKKEAKERKEAAPPLPPGKMIAEERTQAARISLVCIQGLHKISDSLGKKKERHQGQSLSSRTQ